MVFVYNMESEWQADSVISTCEKEKILVFLHNRKPKVWNAKDAVILRESYRVVGVLVGCLPRHPRQNVHLGLPLQLLPEELSLLINKGVVQVVKEKTATAEQCSQRQAMVEQERKTNFDLQQELYREDRRQEMHRQMSHIVEGQKAKRQRMLKEASNDIPTQESQPEGEQLCVDKIPLTATAEKHMLVQLFTENPWTQPTESALDDWKYPETEMEKIRCAVFQDLWEKGMYLTSGHKFGGDFLAYPGDPARFHSFYIVMCVENDRQLPALDLIAMGRLGSSVRKTVLIASLDSTGSALYTSLQWTHMP